SDGEISVAIIGGGFGGISAAYYLHRAGVRNLTIFEAAPRPGGTWYHNRYPGAACDVESMNYSLSFSLKPDWSKVHARQPEILDYIEETVDRLGFRHLFRLNTRVEKAEWVESA